MLFRSNFEFTAREVAFLDRMEEKWETEQAGMYVSEVKQGGWAALGHLAVADLLLSVNETPTADVDTLKSTMKQVAENKPESVVLKVLRGIYTMYLELEPQWENSK